MCMCCVTAEVRHVNARAGLTSSCYGISPDQHSMIKHTWRTTVVKVHWFQIAGDVLAELPVYVTSVTVQASAVWIQGLCSLQLL